MAKQRKSSASTKSAATKTRGASQKAMVFTYFFDQNGNASAAYQKMQNALASGGWYVQSVDMEASNVTTTHTSAPLAGSQAIQGQVVVTVVLSAVPR